MEDTTPQQEGGVSKSRVLACQPCRRRKVKCDHKQPICSNCQRSNRSCEYSRPDQPFSATSGVSRSSQRGRQDEITNRLERLEKLLEKAIEGGSLSQSAAVQNPRPRLSSDDKQSVTATSTPKDRNETFSGDGHDGAVLLEAEGGQSRWVSSLHYALLADEIHDVKILLREDSRESSAVHSPPGQAGVPFPFSTATVSSLEELLPASTEDCFTLLRIFFSNVDPVTRLIHKPSLRTRFRYFVHESYNNAGTASEENKSPKPDSTISTFEPLAFAIFYSAVNSLSSESVLAQFNVEKEFLLAQYQRGVETGLGRENFLTTTSIEVLQAFVLLLTCQLREDDMARTWALLGLAIRVALSQGLHREPSIFPLGNLDAVQVELRRRIWHHICYLDFKTAEGRGQEPTISDDAHTTFLPSNVNDEDLIEGAKPNTTCSGFGFTDMTYQLMCFRGIQGFRKITRSIYRWECQVKSSTALGNSNQNPMEELRSLFVEAQIMVDEMMKYIQTHYLAYCDIQIPDQRLALVFSAVLEWRVWSILWLRIPKQYREALVSPEIRTRVMTKSVSLLESMSLFPDDEDLKKFRWHIASHVSFQAIMHVVSELRNPEFQKAEHLHTRSRALIALERTMNNCEHESSSMWKVMGQIISNCLARNKLNTGPLASQQNIGPLSGDAINSQPLNQPLSFTDHDVTNPDPFPGPTSLENLAMQDFPSGFDWAFWDFDPLDPSSY